MIDSSLFDVAPLLGIAWGPIIMGAATVGSALLGKPKKKKSINLRALIDRYLAMKPGGFVSDEDKLASERTRSRLAGASREAGRGRRLRARRNVTARGLAGSPADLAAELAISQDEALGVQGAAEQGVAQEYDAYSQNRSYTQGMVARAFGAEVGAETENARLDAARESTFWNSILDVVPQAAAYFQPGAKPGAVTPSAAVLPGRPAPRPTYQPRVAPRGIPPRSYRPAAMAF
jgi:hypothetical protein